MKGQAFTVSCAEPKSLAAAGNLLPLRVRPASPYSHSKAGIPSYIDLVLQDTPLNDSDTEKVLRSFVQQVDNLSDREEEKLARLEVRFARVRAFLAYLRSEEEDEATLYELRRSGGVWATPFMPDIISQIEREIEWIERRLKENREIFPEDIKVWSDESELDVPSGGSGEDEAEDTADE